MTEINRSPNPYTTKLIRQLLIVALISIHLKISLASKNPFRNPNICGSPQCDAFYKKFSFRDKIYKYEYHIDLTTEFSGTGGNTSSLFLKATLDVFFPKPCEGFLRINDVKLWDTQVNQKKIDIPNYNDIEAISSNEDDYYGEFSDSTTHAETRDDNDDMHPKSFEMARDLQEHLLRFSFEDGLITEVCPNSKESVWALNFKKGILSAFQNTMSRFDVDFNTTETDTSGECNVNYSLEDTNDVFIQIRKTKDIISCRNRYSTNSILQTTPYNFRDDKNIWPILNSKSYCNLSQRD
ncbi:PREDICTED: uncharacterized protein LOC108361137 isoform X2 [Rhagoletis zephyria]|uniref:uncharacterized protein LOC108361137 isoform X2 n=1 Tax=Rhagoletis zephyria TaxID=28612 RepID=UPI0008117274|nr:PREDICTED: uncharacterized protein LOC108361137 isoform X2 [Rhagoletis zephyria]